MDYLALAEELLQIRCKTEQIQFERSLTRVTMGDRFVLNYLLTKSGKVYPKELSRSMAVSTARIAAILNNLEENGYVIREKDPLDNRQVIVSLTEDGRACAENIRRGLVESAAAVLELLGPEDAMEYIRIQKKLASVCK